MLSSPKAEKAAGESGATAGQTFFIAVFLSKLQKLSLIFFPLKLL